MSKVRIVAIVLCIMVLIALALYIFVNSFYNNKAVSNYNYELDQKMYYYSKLGKKYGNEGTVTVSANYRGAHGESLPHEFNYNFYYDNGKLYIGNDEGYSYMNNELLDIFDFLHSLHNRFIEKQKDKYGGDYYKFDAKKIGHYFNKSIDEGRVEVTYKNVFVYLMEDGKKTDESKIVFDSDMKTGKGKLFGKEIVISENSKGLSLQYDNNLKINIFIKDDHVEYNIVKDNYTYKLYLYSNKIDVSANGDSAVYRGLDMHFEFKDIDFNKNKELDKKDICITRYFNALGKVGSEY